MTNRKGEIKSNNEIISKYADDSQAARAEQIVFGWNSVETAASDIFSSIHRTLLEGDPVFLYKNTNSKSDLCQVVVVRNFEYTSEAKQYTDFGVGVITAGYSMLYPHVPSSYIKNDLLVDLEHWKVDKDVVATYRQIVNRFE